MSWYKESRRHSLARRGIRTVKLPKTITNYSFLYSDFDKDGIINYRDCRPLDPKKQDFKNIQSEEDRQMVEDFLKHSPEYKEASHKMDFIFKEARTSGWGDNRFLEFDVVPKGTKISEKDKIEYGKKIGVSQIPKREGMVYRGMSHQEYLNAKKRGYFKTRGKYNLGYQEGLTFGSTDPDTAEIYSSSFAPIHKKPTPEHKAKVVVFDEKNWIGPEEAKSEGFIVTGEEKAHKGPIPFSSVKEVYELQPEKFEPGHVEIVKDRMYNYPKEGRRHPPEMYGKWRRIYKR